MYFGIALALMLSGASSANINDDNSVVNSNFLHRNRHDDAVSASSSISKKGRSFVVPSSNNLQETELLPSKTTHSVIGSRKIRNSLLENKDHKNKDKTDVLRVIYTADSKTFEVCNDVGLINSCSSAEEICIPLTEQRSLPFHPEDLVTNLTDEEMTEHGVCLNLSPIQATDSLRRKGDDASAAATVADDEGIHHLSSASGHDLLYASNHSSLYIKDVDKEHRRGLGSDSDCEAAGRPAVTVTGVDFQQLITACISSGNDCPTEFKDVPLDCWDTYDVDDMSRAFYYQETFNLPIESWDVSKVTDMTSMFELAYIFNQPLDLWDVSKVTDMGGMFWYASGFNQPMESWNVSEVSNMEVMFKFSSVFNQPIESWDVSKVNKMMAMFQYAPEFNQPMESWNVSEVTNMASMFEYAVSGFNQPIGSWDISKVVDMSNMFNSAGTFNQPIDSWDVSNVTDMYYMFTSARKFNQCLSTWADKTPNDVVTYQMFGGSDCPLQFPSSGDGPWCQDSDICPASEPQGPCTNSEETFQITKKKSTTCMALESSKKARRKKLCQKIAALESCPGICNMKCTCKNKRTFTFNMEEYMCRKAGRKGQPQCNDEVDEKNKVSDLCPKKCGTCYESE